MNADADLIEPSRRAACAMDDAMVARRQWERDNPRPRGLTARQALLVLRFETLLIWVTAQNVRAGITLTEAELERLDVAMRRINAIVDEAAR